ncbi:MAG: hypothetical protein NW207_07335 [Cytophagales bacterium]|nr:hypothetical protein [Cytophagales bacterium]
MINPFVKYYWLVQEYISDLSIYDTPKVKYNMNMIKVRGQHNFAVDELKIATTFNEMKPTIQTINNAGNLAVNGNFISNGNGNIKGNLLIENGNINMIGKPDNAIIAHGLNKYKGPEINMNYLGRVTSGRMVLQDMMNGGGANWSRLLLSNNLVFNDRKNYFELVGGGVYPDFAALRFENDGIISLYSKSQTMDPINTTFGHLNMYRKLYITPDGKFYFYGTIYAKEIEIKTTGFPDYVFHKKYKLERLENVETYINKNKHLKGLPTAKEVSDKGIKITELNKKLVEKIEELTLYIIEQNKRIKALEDKH